MHQKLRLPSRHVCLTVNQLPHDPTSQEVAQLATTPSSYLLIPGHPLSTIDIQQTIITLLPLSLRQVIDIELPFFHPSRPVRLSARYVLFQGKLAGVRICQCPEWPMHKLEWISPWPALQQSYRLRKIHFSPLEIPVGCFYLQLSNCRIGLLFEEDLSNNPHLLKLYDRYKCDILSVSSCSQRDIARDDHKFKNVQLQSEVLSWLKQMAREKGIALIYGGAKVAPSINTIFWDKTFIMQGTRSKIQSPSLIGDMNGVSLIADLGPSLFTHKWNACSDQTESIMTEQLWLEKVEINGWLRSQGEQLTMEVDCPQNKRVLADVTTLKEATLYNLHFLFKTVNQGSPFVLAYPLSSKSEQLLTHLLLLQQHSRAEREQLIAIYSTVSEFAGSIQEIPIYSSFSTMLASNEHIREIVYLYCDDAVEVKKLRQYFGGRICNCDALTPFASDISPNSHGLQSKKIDNACVHVLKGRYQSLQEMLTYFLAIGLNKNEIEKCFTEVLPGKIKMFFKLTPHYLFLLHAEANAIIEAVGEAEVRLKSRDKEGLGSTESVEEVNRITEKIEAARLFKHKVRQYITCHRCQISFKKDLIYWCPHCKAGLCLDCLDIFTHHSLFDLNHYKCYICLGKCPCKQCQPSRVIGQGQNHSANEKDELQHPVFNSRSFECSRCEILSDSYDFIKIECSQCKDLKCYNCARTSAKINKKELDQWLCEDCTQFNWEINHSQQIPVWTHPSIMNKQPSEKFEAGLQQNKAIIHSPMGSASPQMCRQILPSLQKSLSKSQQRSKQGELMGTTTKKHDHGIEKKPKGGSSPIYLWKKGSNKKNKEKRSEREREREKKKARQIKLGEKEDHPQNASAKKGLIFQTKQIAEPESFSY